MIFCTRWENKLLTDVVPKDRLQINSCFRANLNDRFFFEIIRFGQKVVSRFKIFYSSLFINSFTFKHNPKNELLLSGKINYLMALAGKVMESSSTLAYYLSSTSLVNSSVDSPFVDNTN